MTKISVTGPKSQLKTVINTLYELQLMDLEEYNGENLETGEPFEEAEELSKTLVNLRSLLSKLPEQEESSADDKSLEEIQDESEKLEEKVEELSQEIKALSRDKKETTEIIKDLKRLKGIELNFEDLSGTETLKTKLGKIDVEKVAEETDFTGYEVFEGQGATAVVYQEDEDFENTLNSCTRREFSLPDIDYEGSIGGMIEEKKREKKDIERRIQEKEDEVDELSAKWRSSLESAEEFLTEKVEKAEAPLKFATTRKAFIAEGWIPTERLEEIEEVLCNATEGNIHIEEEEGENPPVKHDNPGFVQPFESLTDLMSVPKYNEIDPSFVILLTFPALFGFMIGDAGYGVSSFLVFLAGYRLVPKARDIFKSLMWASFFTILFGLAFGDAFGYVIFGKHSALAHATGIHLFKEIPILFHRAEHLSAVLPVAAAFGVFHVNLAYLLGFYNEYSNHGFVEAFLEKGSWVMLEISALAFYLYGAVAGAPLAMISIALLYKGEGIEGIVEIPSLLSNILSYLRIFGVAVAAVALAKVVNGLAAPMFEAGTTAGLIAGTAILILGHTFNTFIKILEGFLQGIRLHYVEMFGKFYEGGGKKYAPFGAEASA
ncbi:MAG: V-type ATP synthase subunit I [Candidatus Nanosalina sp.]